MMKKANWLVGLATLFLLASCSFGTKKDAPTDELADAANSADFIVDSDSGQLDNLVGETEQLNPTEGEAPMTENNVAEEAIPTAIAEIGQYTIEKNDTFMLIAFKIYGDYGKWKELAQMNPELAGKQLKVGQVVKYNPPTEKFVWSPQGNPRLIKQGDTLGIISKDVYGIEKRWREIFDNNRPMIKDPNLIFAGFTLYYIPDRDVASETY